MCLELTDCGTLYRSLFGLTGMKVGSYGPRSVHTVSSKDPVSHCSAVPVPYMLWVDPSLDSRWSESGVPPMGLGVRALLSVQLSGQDLGTEGCITAPAPGHRWR